MALQLTPPKKTIFQLSVFLGLLGLVVYFLGLFDLIGEGSMGVYHFAFWAALLGWVVMTIGVAAKGV
jgi:hypothetical protein